MTIPFDREFTAPAGVPQRLTPLVTRLLADNPGIFTFRGTGVYIIGAGKTVMVIDPGPDMPGHLAALRKTLEGKTVSHILITHTHADHSPAARAVKAWTGAPIYAFGPHPARDSEDGPRVEEGGDRAFVPDVKLSDGAQLEGDGFTVEALHTPGHMSNHLCFTLRAEGALFSGDHVMGWSTTVVAPPDGDMTDYMNSLEKLIARRDKVIYPTHGGPIHDPRKFLQAYRAHRLAREAAILDCVQDGITSIPAIVEKIYTGVDRKLYPAAGRSVEAHLIKLAREGKISR
jgi:glyoxylase-like metal-dependent hydrolase (beta-lactamase superfamily II)